MGGWGRPVSGGFSRRRRGIGWGKEREGVEAHWWVVVWGLGKAGGRLAAGADGRRRCCCGGVPARRGGAGRAGELHREARKVLGYSIWAIGERTDGSTASRGSPAFMEVGGGTSVAWGGGGGVVEDQ